MEPRWYYLDGEARRGPFSTNDLIAALVATPEPRLVKVWREGLQDWQRAGAQPELSAKLPPRVSGVPQPPILPSGALGDAHAVARLYRRLVLLVGVQLLLGMIINVADQPNPSDLGILLALASFACAVGVVIWLIVTAYQLMKHVDSKTPALWALSMLVPLVNILFLLAISSKAQAWCKQRGIKVGFFGPTKESLDRLRAGTM